MKKALVLAVALALCTGPAFAAKTQPTKSEPQAETESKPAVAAAGRPAVHSLQVSAEDQIASMNPGLAYNFLMDLKLFNLTNPDYAVSPAPIASDWYFYTIYRAKVANVFDNGVGIFADVEKPGYAGITYPTLKVNELYAKYQRGIFYVKMGRQVLGDTEDLLLGFQNDAVRIGFDLDNMDLALFIARTDLYMPWGGAMDGMMGFVPTFNFGEYMGLKAYLLIGTEPITVTNASGTSDKINSSILTGAKYFMDMPVGDAGRVDLGAQLGLQFAMAVNNADVAYDATALGLKLDGGYGMTSDKFGFNVKAHIVFTGGDPDPAVNTKCGFFSPNALVGSGPGLFSKIEDGSGTYMYLDTHTLEPKIHMYGGIFAFGATFDCDIIKMIEPGVGMWVYSNTDKDGKMLGAEIDEWINFKLSSTVSFYQQTAFFMPNKEGLGLPAAAPSPGNTLKFVLGTALNF